MATTINASTSAGLIQTADTSGVLQLQTANTTAITVDASQNVGIGTSSPATKLDVYAATGNTTMQMRIGSGSQASVKAVNSRDSIQIAVDGSAVYVDGGTSSPMAFYTGGAEQMRIDSSGNVGIGTTSPSTGTLNRQLTINSGASNLAGIVLQSNATGTAYNNGTYLTTVNATDFSFFNQQNGYVNFGTNNTERMRIDSSGNVGIGTSSPTNSKLDVAGRGRFLQDAAATTGAIILRQNSGDTVGGHIQWVDNANANQKGYLAVDTSSNMTFATVGTERVRIDSSGNLLVGTTNTNPVTNSTVGVRLNNAGNYNVYSSSGEVFTIGRVGAGTQLAFYVNGAFAVGNIYSSTTATAYNTSSDYRLKENIAPMTGALDTVAKLKPVTYKWKSTGEDGQGFIAHELQEVIPECVTGEKDAVDDEGNPIYQGIDTSFLVATLTAAIQEQQALIADLTTRLSALEGTK